MPGGNPSAREGGKLKPHRLPVGKAHIEALLFKAFCFYSINPGGKASISIYWRYSMFIQVNRENVEDLYYFIQVFINSVREYTTNTVNEYAKKDLEKNINKLETALYRVYHPDLRSIREQSNSLYKAYLSLREIDKHTASRVYRQYLNKKAQAALLEKKLSTGPHPF